MLSFLRQPYPVPYHGPRAALLSAGLVGSFVAFFLIAFKPFGTAEVARDFPLMNLFLAGYGVVVGLIILLSQLVLPGLLPRQFTEDRWTVGKQMVFMALVVGLGITASYFYLLQLGGSPRWRDFFLFFRNSMLIAVVPIVLLTLLDYVRKLRRYETGARSVNETLQPQSSSAASRPAAPPLHLTDDQDRPAVTVPADRLWCLRSDGNYVEVWTLDDGGTCARHLVRTTLTRLEKQLLATAFLRCHRSWIVNPALVEDVTGNAQGYRLGRRGCPTVVVARGRSAVVLEALRRRVGLVT